MTDLLFVLHKLCGMFVDKVYVGLIMVSFLALAAVVFILHDGLLINGKTDTCSWWRGFVMASFAKVVDDQW